MAFCLNFKDKAVQNLVEKVGEKNARAMAQAAALDLPLYERVNGELIRSELYDSFRKESTDSLEAFNKYLDTFDTEGVPIRSNVDVVFKNNPELASIGSIQQYSDYLDNLFPNSQVKDVLFHGGSVLKGDKFSKEYGKEVIPALARLGSYGAELENYLAEKTKNSRAKNARPNCLPYCGCYSKVSFPVQLLAQQ